jgi:hypothetical protein
MNNKKFVASKKIKTPVINDFSLPIYIQRRKDYGITVSAPDMNITRALPLPHQYEKLSMFYQDLCQTMVEVDFLAIEEFKKRDFKTKKRHREKLFPRGLKDHLEIDLHKLTFKPPMAALLTNKSERTWQRWCQQKQVKRKLNSPKFKHRHYQIPFSEIEPHLKKEFVEDPKLILDFVV